MATAIDAGKWSDEYKDAKCSNCAKKKKDQIADYYCYDCNTHLCTPCLGSHNDWNVNHNVVKGYGDNKDVLTEKCGKHADELITYCRQHDELLCKICRFLDHRTCQDPQNIKESSDELNAAPELQAAPDLQEGRPMEKRRDRPVVRPEKKQINVRIQEDKNTCNIRSCCQLSDGSLIVADYNNSRLKLVDPASSMVIKFCEIDEQPTDVCCIGSQEVAVAFNRSTQVHVYNTESLTRTRTVELGHETSWIACNGELLYCAEWYGDILYVHDVKSGRKLRKISKDTSGRQLFFAIYGIAVNSSGDRLYVADWRGLVCVGTDRRLIFYLTDKDLGLPDAYGVTTDHRGHVFVCGEPPHSVVKVTEEGHVVGQIVSEVDEITWSPFCLSYDVSRSSLYVGGESDHLLKVECVSPFVAGCDIF